MRTSIQVVGLLAALAMAPASAEPTAPSAPAAPDRPGLLCVFPQTRPLPECFKGTAVSEQSVRDCDQRNAKRKQVPPRVRVDDGGWVTFAPDRWRCIAAPLGKAFRFQIENHGKLYYSDRASIPATCASHRVDLSRANFYGAMGTKCSRRAPDADDVVAP